ncbi:MAG: aspartate carbamoyltransferase [Thermoprotei archaeon]|nr:MAG: aspartate carbamoyltransferase [Thermoprotei archaeon]RLE89735.1 MAG: aspartate carbamoyltransferase [Thermoprotei archaeon]
MGFKNRDVLTILDFSREDLELLFREAKKMEMYSKSALDILRGKVVALAFFEPSTRTMFSFQTAIQRLGGTALILSDVQRTSIAKGESLGDTIRMLDSYSNAIIIRHKIEGAATYAAEVAEVPVINAGDGTHRHPTQAMVDLYTIWRERGNIHGLTVGVLGDLKYGRAATSFILGIMKYRLRRLYLISPPELRLKSEIKEILDKYGVQTTEVSNIEDVVNELDVLYVTRIQRERFPDPAEYERVRGSYRITLKTLENVKEDLMIMHPLPRVDEILPEVDGTKYAYYFKQARYGVPVRMALLKLVLGD